VQGYPQRLAGGARHGFKAIRRSLQAVMHMQGKHSARPALVSGM